MEYQQKLIILPAVEDMTEPLTVTAYEAIGTGLCYNAVGGNEEDGFVITHLASKKYLCHPIGTEYEVKLLLEKVAPIADWTQSEKELQKHPETGMQFLKIQQTIKSELNMQLHTAMEAIGMPDYLTEDVMNEIEDGEYPILRNALLYAFKIIPYQG